MELKLANLFKQHCEKKENRKEILSKWTSQSPIFPLDSPHVFISLASSGGILIYSLGSKNTQQTLLPQFDNFVSWAET